MKIEHDKKYTRIVKHIDKSDVELLEWAGVEEEIIN